MLKYFPLPNTAGFRSFDIDLWLKARKKWSLNANSSVLSLCKMPVDTSILEHKTPPWWLTVFYVKSPYFNPWVSKFFVKIKFAFQNKSTECFSSKTKISKQQIPQKQTNKTKQNPTNQNKQKTKTNKKSPQQHNNKQGIYKTLQAQRWLTFVFINILASQRYKLRTFFPLTSPNTQPGWSPPGG